MQTLAEFEAPRKRVDRNAILRSVRAAGGPCRGRLKHALSLVREATGPDRGLDTILADLLGLVPDGYWRADGFGHRYEPDWMNGVTGQDWIAPDYTASIDAALALVERIRPDLRVWEMGQLVERRGGRLIKAGWECDLQSVNGEGPGGECDEAATPALALLAALLSAKIDEARHAE